MSITNNNSYLETSWSDCIENSQDFDRLINWLSGEFILYQQDENQVLKVYFPNGWFIVSFKKGINNEYKVLMKHKSKFTFIDIKKQLLLAIDRFKKIN
ncbi:hypothetical protein [Polaribacter glomeratus]|uniref:Uncharacterized protein n=1 Tax=Polaribacter glomeratus TaxID=102 RepID=A0A2S7WVD7_9FLAO|nr:hypothetical protein [Polaribacter glomeratus]PQJ81262.1 hypothetical protein BTO16_01090 [Polaribacter glomeratus]TXD65818.1 hypothetical protein ESX12_09355 [Polaribacter glomeratus]